MTCLKKLQVFNVRWLNVQINAPFAFPEIRKMLAIGFFRIFHSYLFVWVLPVTVPSTVTGLSLCLTHTTRADIDRQNGIWSASGPYSAEERGLGFSGGTRLKYLSISGQRSRAKAASWAHFSR